MKFKAAIISLLSAMLVVGIVTAALLVTEAKKQTDIAQKTAELTLIQANISMEKAVIEMPQDNLEDELIIEHVNKLMNAVYETKVIGMQLNEELWKSLVK